MMRCPICQSIRTTSEIGPLRRSACQECGAVWRRDRQGRQVLDPQLGWLPAFENPHGATADSSQEPEERNVVIPVPDGVSPFELGLLVIDCLVKDHGASVLDYDVTSDRSVVKLRVRAPARTFDSLMQAVAEELARTTELYGQARVLQEQIRQGTQRLQALREEFFAVQADLLTRRREARELTASA
jgi:hypothetical protein